MLKNILDDDVKGGFTRRLTFMYERENKMPKCEHIYGIGPGYKEQGYYVFLHDPPKDGEEYFYEFDHCPECGIRLTKED